MDFKEEIENNDLLNFHAGLKALGTNSKQVQIKPKILGSVNIDDDLKQNYPNDHRWDYLVAIKDSKAPYHFIEVHPAQTSEVKEVIAKQKWLKSIIPKQCSIELDRALYIWVSSGKYNILKTSKQYRQLAQSGIKGPVKFYKYP